MEVLPLDNRITAIDHELLGIPGIGVTYVVQGDSIALIETGTSLTVPQTLAGLDKLGIARDAVEHILCTHIHMDHAGGAGYLADALPRSVVYIHSMTAPHLVDPSRLLPSVRKAVGEAAWPLHGDILPIPASRIRLAEALRLDLGHNLVLEAIATPGHSPDHLSYWERGSGALFIGDAAGLSMPHYDLHFPVTPPPAYDLAAQQATIAMLQQQQISRLYLTHWGAHDDVASTLRDGAERLDELVALVDAALDAGDADIDGLAKRWVPYPADGPAALVAESWSQMSVAGLMRYERKRREQS